MSVMIQIQIEQFNSRHQTSHHSLHNESKSSKETAEICAESSAKGEHASRQSAGTEEERNQSKGEHGSGHEEVVAGADESWRYIGIGVEVSRGV